MGMGGTQKEWGKVFLEIPKGNKVDQEVHKQSKRTSKRRFVVYL